MTFTPADLELSPEAAARLNDYLRQVRAALTGTTDVNPDEIEADIREHVENELHAAPRPVALPALEAVLTKLGPPSQWGTSNDPTLLHRAKDLLRGARASAVERAKQVRVALFKGPEDWRLAYLSFGVFALGVVTFFALFPVTIVISYILSRAGIAHAKERGIDLGAGRKWLLYPPVVLVSCALLAAVTVWPVAAGIVTAQELAGAALRVRDFDQPDPPATTARPYRNAIRERKERLAPQIEEDRKLLSAVPFSPGVAPAIGGVFVGFGAVAIWWMVLGAVTASFPGAVRAVFCPLCDRFEPRHGKWLAVTCFVLLIPWCATAYEIVAALV